MRIKKRNSITLLEIMIVIFLIGIIGSVVGYNIKGSLERGKLFKSEQAVKRMRDIFLLEISMGRTTGAAIAENPRKALEDSELASDTNALLKDGWGYTFKVVFENNDFTITSDGLQNYYKNHSPKTTDCTDPPPPKTDQT